jgi:branched-chain amino acid transport system substrate-binding protein
VHEGKIEYRRITMEKPYARVGEDGVQYSGPQTPDLSDGGPKIAIFGPRANDIVKSPEILKALQSWKGLAHASLIPVPADAPWGKASSDLVNSVYRDHVLAVIALDRNSGHLAEQIGVKAFVPVIAISSDHSLTSTNIPWVFRLPEGTPATDALKLVSAAIAQAGSSRSGIREILASGRILAGTRFDSNGEMKQ